MIRPTHIVHDLSGINPERFCAENRWLRAVSYDREGTVTDYHSLEVPEAHIAVMKVFAGLGVEQGFNSNSNSEERVEEVSRVATRISEIIGTEFFVATSFEAGGRKPGYQTFKLFAEKSRVPVDRTAHVGDQWLKDIRGARNAGLRGAILVTRYGSGDDWRVRYLQRPLETGARLRMGIPLQQQKFPSSLRTSDW